MITITLNAINFLYCFFKDIYRVLRLLYYKVKYFLERIMKKTRVLKMIPFMKEEEKKQLPHPADAKCMIDSK